jgi:hypothetical protein
MHPILLSPAVEAATRIGILATLLIIMVMWLLYRQIPSQQKTHETQMAALSQQHSGQMAALSGQHKIHVEELQKLNQELADSHERHLDEIQRQNRELFELQATTFREALERIVAHSQSISSSQAGRLDAMQSSISGVRQDLRAILLRLEAMDAMDEEPRRRRRSTGRHKAPEAPEGATGGAAED